MSRKRTLPTARGMMIVSREKCCSQAPTERVRGYIDRSNHTLTTKPPQTPTSPPTPPPSPSAQNAAASPHQNHQSISASSHPQPHQSQQPPTLQSKDQHSSPLPHLPTPPLPSRRLSHPTGAETLSFLAEWRLRCKGGLLMRGGVSRSMVSSGGQALRGVLGMGDGGLG